MRFDVLMSDGTHVGVICARTGLDICLHAINIYKKERVHRKNSDGVLFLDD